MIPAEDLAMYLQALASVRALAVRDLRRVWKSIDPTNMTQHYDDLLAAVSDIVAAYGEVSAVASAEFYDAVAAGTGRALPPAELAAIAPAEQIETMLRAALGPLWADTPQSAVALTRLEGGVTRLSLLPGRETIFRSAKRDGAKYAIVPQGKTCAFCLMLASRGAVYTDRQPHYHDHCDCACVPVFRDDDLPQINRELADEWKNATKGQVNQRAAWRRYVQETYGV